MRLSLLLTAAGAAAALILAGCGAAEYSTEGNRESGKQLFIARCAGCHVLAAAGTAGTIGPNLDDAFAQSRADGLTTDTFTQVIRDQILYPIEDPVTDATGMPGPDETLPECDDVEGDAFCVEDRQQAVDDIGVYVGAVAGTGVTTEKPTDGKSIFATTCAQCHTLADAGTAGTVGPNLDQSKPPKTLVTDRVTNGKGTMPSFKDSLDRTQIEAVAEYVSSAAGK
ncbi:MAG: c-type cytochrome [Actinobacteria bacterium]|nr:c-type cytochrome [Actinomycetota bacterium]